MIGELGLEHAEPALKEGLEVSFGSRGCWQGHYVFLVFSSEILAVSDHGAGGLLLGLLAPQNAALCILDLF